MGDSLSLFWQTLTVVFLTLGLFSWETFGIWFCFPQRESYPEFGRSLFVGNGSFVMRQHFQMCLQPPAWARLNSPIRKKQVKVDIWKPSDPLLGQQHIHYCMEILLPGLWLAWSSAPPCHSPLANPGRQQGDPWLSPPACSPDADPPLPAPVAASPSGGTTVGVVGRPPTPGCWRLLSSSSCQSAGSVTRLCEDRAGEEEETVAKRR